MKIDTKGQKRPQQYIRDKLFTLFDSYQLSASLLAHNYSSVCVCMDLSVVF